MDKNILLEKIENYSFKVAAEKKSAEELKAWEIEKYKEDIRLLKPRIDNLLEIGNACLQNDIPLTGRAWGGTENYETHQFITNSWSHLVGFVSNRKEPFKFLGIHGGGACHYNLETDGEIINVSGEVHYVLKKFVSNFNEFEEAFYNYVNEVTK